MLTRYVALALLMTLPFACGGRAEAPGPGMCQAVAYGGWDGTPECSGIASIIIAPEFRTCRVDQDCALVAQNRCSAHAANHQGAQALGHNPPPCVLPAIGNLCPPAQMIPRCQQGCCVPSKM